MVGGAVQSTAASQREGLIAGAFLYCVYVLSTRVLGNLATVVTVSVNV